MKKAIILVVEDEAIIATDLQWRLQDMGYDVPVIAASGEEAVKRVRADNVDLVLMDIMLQGAMDGIESAGQIHSEYDIPVVFLTAYADNEMLERAKITEPFGYLIKPVRDRELFSTIEMALYKYKMEKQIKESENKYRTLLENLPQKIFFKDRNSVYISCNGNFAQDLKIEPEEIVGKTDFDFFNKELAEKYRTDDRRIIESGEAEDLNEEYIRNGEKQFIHTVKTPIKDEKGRVIGIVGIFWDVTNIMRARTELKKYRTSLESMVQERTDELIKANKQLQLEILERKRMEERIRASLEERGVLLREIHHRVGNNLQVIYGLLDMHSDAAGDKEYANIFKGCQDRIMSMSLVHKTLFRSTDLAHIDFYDYIKKLVNRLFNNYGVDTERVALKINAKGISVGLETAIPLGLIITELVSNSLKHAFPESKKGEIKIEIRSLGNNENELIISDNGIGLPEEIDFRNTETLGFKTISAFEKSSTVGEFELNRVNGTEFRIRFRNV
jgi:PAS domain S-box-containing protein